MLGTILSVMDLLLPALRGRSCFYPTFKIEETKAQKGKSLAQDHTAGKSGSQDSNPGSLAV